MSPISGALALGAAALATRGLQSASFTSATPPTGLVVPNTGDLTLFASWSGETTKVEFESAVNGLIPLTVVASHNVTTATCEWVKDEVKRFQSADDVMTDNFLECTSSGPLSATIACADSLTTCRHLPERRH